MEKLIKQCVGIDISKAEFSACICSKMASGEFIFSSVEHFENSKRGFNQLLKWSRKITTPGIEQLFLMEATGVYYESLAYHLYRLKQSVTVALPNKVKHFSKSLNVKTKTDVIDAKVIAQLGAERQLEHWRPPAPILKMLRDLTRLYTELKGERTVYLNRLDCKKSSEIVLPFVVKVNRDILKELDQQIEECEKEIERLLFSEDWLSQKVQNLLTIKGIGLITIAIIIAETQGFALVKNRKQLASYAGYDIVQRESGTSIKGKTRISKKGNSRIRAALYFPAVVASRYNDVLKEDYKRINRGKPNRLIGITALQRKILLLCFTLWKNNEGYNPDKIRSSGNQNPKFLLRLGDEITEKTGNPEELPAQDGLPLYLSPEALLRL